MAGETDSGKGPAAKAGSGKRTSLATRLAVVVLLVSITSILITLLVATFSIDGDADALIDQRIRTRLNSIASELNFYFVGVERDVTLLAISPTNAKALKEFTAAYEELDSVDPESVEEQHANVAAYYVEEFIPSLAEVRGSLVDPDSLVPQSSPAPIYLQSAYIADSPVDASDRRLITDPGDGSSWTDVHSRFHPGLRERVEGLGFEDMFLIDAESQAIVYSTNKDIAFGTNIVSGPQTGTSLAALIRSVLATGEPGVVRAADFDVYPPLLDQPSGFLAAPMFDDETLVGVVAVSIDLNDVSDIMSGDWREGRFGETGESYLVGSDRTMRSDSRFFIEDSNAFLVRIDELGNVDDEDRRRMDALGTTVLFQPVDNDAVRDGLDGQTGDTTVTNYLGNEVFSAYTPIAPESFDWVLMVEQGIDEASEPFSDYLRSVLTVTVVFVVALTFLSVGWASGFVAPIRRMGAALRSTRKDELPTAVPITGVTEFRELAGQLNDMVDSLAIRKEAVLRALRGKTAVLRTLLPASAIAQVRVGDRKFVETVPQASVVVVKMGGIDTLFPEGDIDEHREFLTNLIEEADGLAASNGLERVKVTGANYFAVSGLETPHLDHAPRAARFAAECVRALRTLAEDSNIALDLSAGIAAGTITAGLVGDTRLVFDLWGDPVDDAYRLAQVARKDTIYVTAATRQRLPGGSDLHEVQLGPDDVAWSIDALDADSAVTA